MSQGSPNAGSVFTIGHSNLELAEFLSVLVKNGVQLVCDVRSRPGSYRFPQFNRECLEVGLASVNIQYEFLGESLGGRPADSRAYHEDGRVDYTARRRAPDFVAGIEQVVALSRAHTVVLLCAEEDPLHCHRFLMICPALLMRGVTPVHIRRGGVLDSQREAEDRLLALNDLSAFTSDSLFALERDSALEEALRRQAQEYAFRGSPEQLEDF
ncbi:MAG TPA: DUF488 domain-containing protein [Methylomirabilota bacterium]|nr:DUF488 domain-containing protein [Methylomirabilota bacterium]